MENASHNADRGEAASTARGDRRVVILRHDTGIEHHFDWMFDTGSGEDEALETWRCVVRPDLAGAGEVLEQSQRLEDHRRAYLEYEGEVSQGRGTVIRLAQGTYRQQSTPEGVTIREIRWSNGIVQRWAFDPAGPQCMQSGGESRE